MTTRSRIARALLSSSLFEESMLVLKSFYNISLSFVILLSACAGSPATIGIDPDPNLEVHDGSTDTEDLDGGMSDAQNTDAGKIEDATICSNGDSCDDAPVCLSDGYCIECVSDSSCDEERPLCAPSGFCVECVSDQDCIGEYRACNQVTGTCTTDVDASICDSSTDCSTPETVDAGCQDDSQCEDDQVCRPQAGICVDCVENSDCNDESQLCDPMLWKCVECLASENCREEDKPICENGECVECVDNDDCESGKRCSNTYKCVGTCLYDDQCTDEDAQYCDSQKQQCFSCVEDAHCGEDKPFCLNNECVGCRSNADCPKEAHVCDEYECND